MADVDKLLQADLGPGVWVCIGIYLGLLLCIGALSAFRRRKAQRNGERTHELDDHYNASQTLGYTAMVFTVVASLMSGYSIVGVAADAYSNGFAAYKWLGGIVSIAMGYALLIPRLHRISVARGGYTSGIDVICDRWRHHSLRVSFAVTQLFCMFLYMMTQFIAMGSTIQGLSNGAIPAYAGCIFLGAIMLLYEAIGGMQAIAWTDILQGVVLTVGCIFLLIVQHTVFGGLADVVDFFYSNSDNPALFRLVAVPTITQQVQMLNFIFIVSTLYCYPFMMQRAFAAKSEKRLRYGFAALCGIVVLVYAASSTFGISGRRMMVEEYDDVALPSADNIFGVTMRYVMLYEGSFTSANYVLGSVILAAVIAALMSSADSALLSMSCILTMDVVQPYCWKNATRRQLVWFGRLMSLFFTVLVVGVTSYAYSHGFNVGLLVILQQNFLTQLAPGYLAAVYIKSAKPRAILLGFWFGVFWTCIFDYAIADRIPAADGAPEKYISETGAVGITAGLPAFFFNVLVAWLAHYLPWFKDESSDHTDKTWNERWGSQLTGDLIGFKIPSYPRELIHGWFGVTIACCYVVLFCFFVPWCFPPETLTKITVGGLPSWAAVSMAILVAIAVIMMIGNLFFWEDVPHSILQQYDQIKRVGAVIPVVDPETSIAVGGAANGDTELKSFSSDENEES